MKYFAPSTFFALIFSLLFFVGSAHAEDVRGSGLSVDPVFQEVSFGAQEAQIDFFVTLKNGTGAAMVLRPSVVDFGSLDESGGVAFLGQSGDLGRKYALASWMRPEKDVLFLDSGETEKLRVTIENRDALSPGGHYGAILFRVGNENDAAPVENAVAVNQLVSVLVFAKKQGGEIYDLQLKGKEWSKNPLVLARQFRLRFQNAGNVHVVPRGLITLADPLGRIVEKGVINPESTFILPETLRSYAVTLQDLAWALIPGKYTFSVSYRYDGKDDFVTEQESVMLFPWRGIVIVLSVVAALWFWRSLLRKQRLQRIKK